MTINPDGFVARHLVATCAQAAEDPILAKYAAEMGEGWEDYTSELKAREAAEKSEGLQFGDELIKQVKSLRSKWSVPEPIFFTSYNPEVGQTDSTPCIAGGTGYNLCEMWDRGERTIALSQELIDWSIIGQNAPYSKGDVVYLVSDEPQCNGKFIVADAMNIRYRKRGDIFQRTRATNTSCWATILNFNPNEDEHNTIPITFRR